MTSPLLPEATPAASRYRGFTVPSAALFSARPYPFARVFRKTLFELTIRQDSAWFDEKDALTVPASALLATRKISDALGKTLALAVQNGCQFIGGYGFAVLVSWRLTLVCTAMLPVLGGSTYLFVSALSLLAQGNNRFYVEAGAVADETFANVKTVAALGAEEAEMSRYGGYLTEARRVKGWISTRVGFQISSMWAWASGTARS